MSEELGFKLELLKHQVYMEERGRLIDAAREGARSFDKTVLTVASGSFGFSIVILKDVVPTPSPDFAWMLGMSWISFALTILVSLVSHLLSQKACNKEIDRAGAVYEEADVPTNPWSQWTEWANYTSLGILFLGIVLWGLFVYANLFWKG